METTAQLGEEKNIHLSLGHSGWLQATIPE